MKLSRGIGRNVFVNRWNSFSKIPNRPPNFLGLIGVCEDGNSSYSRGAALAPGKIRECFQSDSSNTFSEMRIDISPYIRDYGDFTPQKEFLDVEEKIQKIHKEHRIPLVLGGDHSITAPVFNTIRKLYTKPITIVHFDAHPDLYPLFQDNPHSHASPFARILERSHENTKLIQIGIRTLNDVQYRQVEKYGVTLIEAKDFPAKGSDILPILKKNIVSNESLVYISIDIDVLEPGLAPGISHPESGGLSVRQLIDAIHSIPGRIIGADIVEYNPTKDIRDVTGFVASKLLKEISSKIILSNLTK